MSDLKQLAGLSSVAVERRILEVLMNQDDAFDRYSDMMNQDIFFSSRHQLIFRAIKHLKATMPNEAVDPILVLERLERFGKLDEAGGEEYLLEILSNPLLHMSNDLSQHIATLEDLRLRRELTEKLSNAVKRLSDKSVKATDVLHECSDDLAHAQTGRVESQTFNMTELLTELMDELEHLQEYGESFMATGFEELDSVIMPDKGNLWVIAGRPSMGKTILAENVTRHIAKTINKSAVIFSLEMNRVDMTRRMVSAEGSIPISALKQRFRSEDHNASMLSVVGTRRDVKIHVNADRNMTLNGIKTELARVQRQDGEIGVVMVDYLQIMHEVIQAGNDKHNKIAEVTRGLRALAQQYNCLMILLSQVNRQCESRPNKRPNMGDLKESSAIEQDADIITLVYREDKYRENVNEMDNVVEVIVGKNRNGVDRTVRLGFEGQYSRFVNLTPDFAMKNEKQPFMEAGQ